MRRLIHELLVWLLLTLSLSMMVFAVSELDGVPAFIVSLLSLTGFGMALAKMENAEVTG